MPQDDLTEAEIAKRRDDALRRALNTPPQPKRKTESIKVIKTKNLGKKQK